MRHATGSQLANVVLVALAVIIGVVFVGSQFAEVFRKSNEANLISTSGENMSRLTDGLIAYCRDHGNRLPPRPAKGDWVAARWIPGTRWLLGRRVTVPKIAEPGPLAQYVPEWAAWCPLDPGPVAEYTRRGGYEWNLSLAGKTLDEVVGKPVLWPYRPWTRNGRWVHTVRLSPGYLGYPAGAKMPGSQWVREDDFQQAVRSGKLPTYEPAPGEG